MRQRPFMVMAHCPALSPFNLCKPRLLKEPRSERDSAASKAASKSSADYRDSSRKNAQKTQK